MYINSKHNLAPAQVQQWLMQAGVSDYDFLQCLAQAKEYAERLVMDPASKVKLDAYTFLKMLITSQN